MTDKQATELGEKLCDLLPIREEDPGIISTEYGDKTYKGLGYMVNTLVSKIILLVLNCSNLNFSYLLLFFNNPIAKSKVFIALLPGVRGNSFLIT